MNKLLVVLSILVHLSIVITASNKSSTITILQWESCRKNALICDSMTPEQQGPNQVNLYACYAAANNAFSVYNYDSATISSNCKAWQNIYKKGIAQNTLPDSYFACINDAIPYAQNSDFYFNNIFKPLYMSCAGV